MPNIYRHLFFSLGKIDRITDASFLCNLNYSIKKYGDGPYELSVIQNLSCSLSLNIACLFLLKVRRRKSICQMK